MQIVAGFNLSNQITNIISPILVYTVPTNKGGFYRISGYFWSTVAAQNITRCVWIVINKGIQLMGSAGGIFSSGAGIPSNYAFYSHQAQYGQLHQTVNLYLFEEATISFQPYSANNNPPWTINTMVAYLGPGLRGTLQ